MFEGREIVIATKHRKEQVIAPLLIAGLGVKCIVPKHLDTDLLGTFAGEVERSADAIATARKKCELAMDLEGCDLAIASEGSFGPHPELGFIPVNEEILLLIDRKNNLEIVSRKISLDTNFAQEEIQSEAQLFEFAERAMFPSHGLILRPTEQDVTCITKGITDKKQLSEIFKKLRHKQETVFAETDMRAVFNPKRMSVIREATLLLLSKARSCCPECYTPGFGVTKAKPGLPCGQCSFPSRSILSEISTCSKCQFSTEKMYPHAKTVEDPMYCQLCNP
jgi:hypothetical protein